MLLNDNVYKNNRDIVLILQNLVKNINSVPIILNLMLLKFLLIVVYQDRFFNLTPFQFTILCDGR